MRLASVPASVLTLVLAWPVADADAASRRKECRQACGAAIEACVEAGGKRKRCKRQTLKTCRRQGVGACAPTTTTTTTSAGATTTLAGGTTTTGGGTSTQPGGSTTTTVAGGSTTTLATVHECTVGMAVDRRAPGADRSIAFTSYSYTPRCMLVAAGQTVTFGGSFGTHPLVGGEVVGNTPTPDPQSPIGFVDSGASTQATFPGAGVFPFYCDEHGLSFDMRGAIYVVDP
jgi:plastocyanin